MDIDVQMEEHMHARIFLLSILQIIDQAKCFFVASVSDPMFQAGALDSAEYVDVIIDADGSLHFIFKSGFRVSEVRADVFVKRLFSSRINRRFDATIGTILFLLQGFSS